MEQYIPKAEVVAEIEGRLSLLEGSTGHPEVVKRVEGVIKAYKSILSFLDTLEVKDIELEQETQRILNEHFFYPEEDDELKEIPKLARYIAKHFFELGLKAKVDDALVEEIYSHIDSIKDTADIMTSGNFMHHRAAIKFSANVIRQILELIGFKAQKGE